MQIDQAQLAHELVEQARTGGVELVSPADRLTKTVLEIALEAGLSAHLGSDEYDPAGRNGQNSRNDTRIKTVLTGVGPVAIEVPATVTGRSAGDREKEPASSG